MPTRHHGYQLVSIAVEDRSAAAARRDSSVDVSSSQSNQRVLPEIVEEGLRWGEANRSLWPNSEFHEESLPAMPVLLFSRAQNKYNTMGIQLAMGNSGRHEGGSPQTDRRVHGGTARPWFRVSLAPDPVSHRSSALHRTKREACEAQSGDYQFLVAALACFRCDSSPCRVFPGISGGILLPSRR